LVSIAGIFAHRNIEQALPRKKYQQKAGFAARSGSSGCRSPSSSRPEQHRKEEIMAYVLIVVRWLGGVINGAAISTQGFTSAERCEAARLTLIEDAKGRNFDDTLKPLCMQSEERGSRHHPSQNASCYRIALPR
jgi:hypothetical protein